MDLFVRKGLLALWDIGSWFGAALALVAARYDFELNEVQWSAIFVYALIVASVQLVGGIVLKMYLGRYRIGSFDEALALALLTGGIGIVVGIPCLILLPGFPRGVALTAPIGALALMAVGRWAYRALMSQTRQLLPEASPRALIYGAGDAGHQLLRALRGLREPPFSVVGFVDDASTKRHLRLDGVRVLGNRSRIPELARATGASHVILAIASADAAFVRRLSRDVQDAGLKLLVVPPLNEMLSGRVEVERIREVDIADLLGRRQIKTDLSQIATLLTGNVVLITGAGGSIGSEIARQVHAFQPRELLLLDRDESALHRVQLQLYGRGLLDTDDMILCDIRDLDALDKVFAKHRPNIVFHAAALKHLPMLEQYPDEGWKTNVLGTLNVLTCARRHGVDRLVNISTDKAADPSSILGTTKRYAERLTAWFAADGAGTYLSVRFGNVLGSRGSMLQTFMTQIEQGGPITVTHPDVTRYFMTIPEACELTLQATASGKSGHVLVLDMGEPVRILDVAHQLMQQAGRTVEIVYTGLRPGEKLHEALFGSEEASQPSNHPLIRCVQVSPLDPADVASRDYIKDTDLRQPSAELS